MNEPNLNGWLAPQGAYAAVKYRALYRAGHAGLVASGNGKDRILMGELAPTKTKRTTAPVTFYREVFCLSSRGHRLTGKAARRLSCAKFKKLPASGIAHHPYTNAAACTPRCKGGSTDITIASLSRLAKVLDQASRAGRLSSTARTHIWLTEFGFQSNPPNPGPISLREQAAYINWSEWKGFTSGRVRSYGQYELVDPGAATFNTGLFLQSLKAKPSLTAYRTPLFVVKSGRSVKVFGGARPGGRHRIAIQAKSKSGKYRTVKRVTSNGVGYVYARLGYRKTWRLTWVERRDAVLLAGRRRRQVAGRTLRADARHLKRSSRTGGCRRCLGRPRRPWSVLLVKLVVDSVAVLRTPASEPPDPSPTAERSARACAPRPGGPAAIRARRAAPGRAGRPSGSRRQP